MSPMAMGLLYATIAGAAIPLGALLARVEHFQPNWLEAELRHSVVAFGGGVLLAAVALVLVPEGTRALAPATALPCFIAGGVAFFLLDRFIERRAGAGAQLMATLLDFIPEAMALGALLVTAPSAGLLIAILIALQNLPEGFNSYREIIATSRIAPGALLAAFCLLVPLGPLAAWIGFAYLAQHGAWLGAIMLIAAGGILYLIFEDIAPQARLARHWAPPLGAVLGFAVGLAGHLVLA